MLDGPVLLKQPMPTESCRHRSVRRCHLAELAPNQLRPRRQYGRMAMASVVASPRRHVGRRSASQ